MPLQALLKASRERVDAALERWLPAPQTPPRRLHAAMRYAALGGGKRIRPFLVYAAGRVTGAELVALDAPAAAVELIHTYSLVHDDLPAMDDDDLRRGRPTCHRAFDEATALLVGDALQSLAFRILAGEPLPVDAATRAAMVERLAAASGSLGMAGGQALDLAAVGQSPAVEELEAMHRAKTGALIRASVALGAFGGGCGDDDVLARLDRYAEAVGLAFQVQDDILDVTADTATLGKPQGSDAARNKPTYPALLGLDGARARAGELCDEALDALAPMGPAADALRGLARYVVDRAH